VRARKVIKANGLGDVITVLQGTVETVHLPGKVDVIVSEWMGYFLLRESMLDSVLEARDKFLKPGGMLFPSHATLYLAPAMGPIKVLKERWQHWEGEAVHWNTFVDNMEALYGVDYSSLEQEFLAEQKKYYLHTGIFVNLTGNSVCSQGSPIMEIDLSKVTLEELRNPTEPYRCEIKIARNGTLQGFAGYFDTLFQGASDGKGKDVTLSTAPDAGSTHWGQQLFGFYPPLEVKKGDILTCEMLIKRQAKNHRLLELESCFALHRGQKPGKTPLKEVRQTYYVD